MEFETVMKPVRADGVSEGERILIHFRGENEDAEKRRLKHHGTEDC